MSQLPPSSSSLSSDSPPFYASSSRNPPPPPSSSHRSSSSTINAPPPSSSFGSSSTDAPPPPSSSPPLFLFGSLPNNALPPPLPPSSSSFSFFGSSSTNSPTPPPPSSPSLPFFFRSSSNNSPTPPPPSSQPPFYFGSSSTNSLTPPPSSQHPFYFRASSSNAPPPQPHPSSLSFFGGSSSSNNNAPLPPQPQHFSFFGGSSSSNSAPPPQQPQPFSFFDGFSPFSNAPSSFSFHPFFGSSSTNAPMLPPPPPPASPPFPELDQMIFNLTDPQLRENALSVLFKHRDLVPDLGLLLWHSSGTIAALLQEVISVYPLLTPPTLNAAQSNRVCNALALFQTVASHADTRRHFLKAQLPLYLYALLNTTSDARPFEYLRLTAWGVFGSLLKADDTEVVKFLLQTDIVPLCFHTMEYGSDLTKTVATYIMQRLIMDNVGLEYMCDTAERFFSLSKLLEKMVISLAVPSPPVRLLKHIIRCYLRLTEHPRGCDALGVSLPFLLKTENFIKVIHDDIPARQMLMQLFYNIDIGGKVPEGVDPYNLVM